MLKIFSILFLPVFLMTLSGCDALYRMLDKEGAEEKEIVGEIIPFEKNPTIQEIQRLLKVYGYNPGKADGVLGVRTRNALEKFQKENGLNQTRFADQETWRKLKIFRENGFIVNDALNVQMVQQSLAAAGYDPGNIDGKFGPKTRSNILKFQEAHGLKVDGKVGYQTLSALFRYYVPRENAHTDINGDQN